MEPLYRSGTTITHWHCGVDIGMPTGTPLFAAREGVVSRTGYGFVGIKSGVETHYYVHVDRAVVGLGSAVAIGQLIAYSGAKVPAGGYLTGPHLHFERNAQPVNTPPGVDPMPLLQFTASAGSGTVEDKDLTPEEHSTLMRIDSILSGARLNTKAVDQALIDIAAVIAKIPTATTAGALTPAQAQQLSDTLATAQATLVAIQRLTLKAA